MNVVAEAPEVKSFENVSPSHKSPQKVDIPSISSLLLLPYPPTLSLSLSPSFVLR